MPPPPDLEHYRLSPADSQRIFTERILPEELPSTASPSPAPLAVLAVGQTGAGKSIICGAILAALARPPVHLIADTYKTYHPSYDALMRASPHLASPATGPDARRWLEMAVAEAAARRVDVLLESACRHPDDFTRLASILRDASYRVEVVVLAVPAALSRLGILVRYCERRPEAQSKTLPVRLTPKKVHDDSYEGLVAAAEFLEAEDVADQVLVVCRGGLVAYGVSRSAEGWTEDRSIAASVSRERQRPLTDEEWKRALHDVQLLEGHDEVANQVAEVRELLDPLIGGRDDAPESPDASSFPNLVPLVYGEVPKDDLQAQHVLRLGRGCLPRARA